MYAWHTSNPPRDRVLVGIYEGPDGSPEQRRIFYHSSSGNWIGDDWGPVNAPYIWRYL